MFLVTMALAAVGVVGVAGTAQAYDITCGAYGQTPSFNCVSYTGYTGQRPWGYPVDANGHNCTNYTSYRLWQNGVANPGNLGNAPDWDNNASGYGIPVDNNPTVGSIAVWEVSAYASAGHVAYVEAVTGSYVDVSEDNYGGTTMLKRFYVGQANWPNHFIHFTNAGSVTASSPLTFSAPGGFYANAPLTTTFTVHNGGSTSVSIAVLSVSVRDPGNANYDQTCRTNFSLAAGASYTCTITQWWNSVGTYTMWPDWEDSGGTWHPGDLGGHQTVTLSAPGHLEAVSALAISAPSGKYANAPLNEAFTVKNTTGSTQNIAVLTLSVRDPAGVNYDQLCNTNFSLAAGASYTCNLSQYWNSTGTYTMWADWEDTSGNWHQGQLGPNQQVVLSSTPALLATSPLTITAPSGYHPNVNINEAFTVKNTTGSTQNIAVLTLSVRDPAGVNYDQLCNTNFSLAAGASYTCNLSQYWNSTGTYTMWADWEDTSGNWHQGQLGPNQQVVLS